MKIYDSVNDLSKYGKKMSKYDQIKENTIIYIVNGCWIAEIIKDANKDELVLYTPYTKEVRQIDQNASYFELFPSDTDIIVYNKYKDFDNAKIEIAKFVKKQIINNLNNKKKQ